MKTKTSITSLITSTFYVESLSCNSISISFLKINFYLNAYHHVLWLGMDDLNQSGLDGKKKLITQHLHSIETAIADCFWETIVFEVNKISDWILRIISFWSTMFYDIIRSKWRLQNGVFFYSSALLSHTLEAFIKKRLTDTESINYCMKRNNSNLNQLYDKLFRWSYPYCEVSFNFENPIWLSRKGYFSILIMMLLKIFKKNI